MSRFQFILITLHVLAAVVWVGGMTFLSLVLAPLIKKVSVASESMALFWRAAVRFRLVVWTAVALLLTSGPMLLYERGLNVFEPGQWPQVLRIKLGLVVPLVALTVTHDLLLGPLMRRISSIPKDSRSSWERTIVHIAPWVPRATLLLALGVLSTGVVLVRS